MTFQAVLEHYAHAMFNAQWLESLMVGSNLFLAEDSRQVDANDISELTNKLNKMPLGHLRSIWESHWQDKHTLHPDVIQYFRDITILRNYLAHHFFRFHRFEKDDADSLQRQLQELVNINQDFQNALLALAALDHLRRDKTDWTQFRRKST